MKNIRIWRQVISLRQTDAERLGYDTPEAWRNLLRSKQFEIASYHRIPAENMKWYAAFHKEEGHYHVHFLLFNKEPGGEFLCARDYNRYKDSLTKTIFKDEMKQLYDQRQSLRDKIVESVKEKMNEFSADIGEAPDGFAEAFVDLKFSLDGYTGKNNYQFISREQKEKVDAVVKIVCKDQNLQDLYQQWCQVLLNEYKEVLRNGDTIGFEDVLNIHNDLNGYYKLTANIDMSGIDFEPIGNETEGAFTGTIDGNGHTISNLTVEDYKYCGFVGYLDGGNVKNISLKNLNVSGYEYIGGIAGYTTKDAVILNCDVSGKINGNWLIGPTHIGGISGYNNGCIENCINNGTDLSGNCVGGISGTNYGMIDCCSNKTNIFNIAGGITAYNYGTIYGCINNGNIIKLNYGSSCTGGITYHNKGMISNCQNNGNISAAYCVGGIAAINEGNGKIIKCENNGCISSSRDDYGDLCTGGIVGVINTPFVEISNCINRGVVVSSITSIDYRCGAYAGGITGLNLNGSLSHCIQTGKNIAFSTGNSSAHAGTITGEYISSFNTCYSLGNTNYSDNNLLNVKELQNTSNLKEFGFENIWYVDPKTSSGFPQLRNMPRHIQLNECIELFEVGDSNKLIAYLEGNIENVTWSSNDTSIATVTADGTVTAKSIGACTVTATNNEGMKANCLIYVYGRAESMTLNKSETTLAVGSSETLTYTQNPSTANETVRWYSDDKSIATVNQSGYVRGVKSGTATIYAVTTNSEIAASCKVTVTGKPVTSISLSATSATLNINETKQLSATVYPSDYEGKITWSSSDANIATVDGNGLITAKHPGMAYIYAQAESSVTNQCNVTVKAPANGRLVQLMPKDITVKPGKVDLSIDYDKKDYTTYKLMIWEGMNSIKPLVDVK